MCLGRDTGQVEIWVNPACSKCRSALSSLDAAGLGYTVRRYLEDPPTAAELAAVVERLGLEPWDIARAAEAAAAGIDLPRDVSRREDWFAVLAANPRAIQRPIVTADDGTTVVARDPAAVARVVAAQVASSAE